MKIKTLIIVTLLFCGSVYSQNSKSTSVQNSDNENSWSGRDECFDSLVKYNPGNDFSLVKLTFYARKNDSVYFHLTCSERGRMYLRRVDLPIDMDSIEDLGEFLIDKNRVYRYYDRSDGRLIFELKDADRDSFVALEDSIYGKDKYHVFDSRHGIIEIADVETFKQIKIESDGRVAYGMDKNNYFFWNQIVTDTVGFANILNKK